MKHLTPTLAKLFAILFLMLTVACSSSNGGEEPIPDPTGTQTREMLYADYNGIRIGDYADFLLIGLQNTFEGRGNNDAWEFVSVGPVSGLAEITEIPKTGWTKDLEIVPGNGYVICIHAGRYATFCRLYAVEYIESGYRRGIKVKLQEPFNGTANEIGLSQNSLFLDANTPSSTGKYNSQNIYINNVSFKLTAPKGYSGDVYFENSRLGIRIYKSGNSTDHNPTLIFSSKGLPNEELKVTP